MSRGGRVKAALTVHPPIGRNFRSRVNKAIYRDEGKVLKEVSPVGRLLFSYNVEPITKLFSIVTLNANKATASLELFT